eukprot:scaffold125496_cov69-Phaeocystis_antarctica.AAC.2
MSLVERGPDEWSLLALTVNPTERKQEAIAAAERAALVELCALAQAAGAKVRVHAPAAATLAGDSATLGLTSLGDETPWLRAAA